MTNLIRLLLVDDHPVVRNGIRGLLEKAGDIEIVGEASRGEEVLPLVEAAHPDLILLDMELPDIQGTQVARQVLQGQPRVKILALSAHDDPVYIRSLLKMGAAGYLVKEEAPEMILEAIRGIAQGEKGWLSRKVAAQAASWLFDEGGQTLTEREQEVLHLVVRGKTNQAIAVELDISEKTVEKYMGDIFSKLGVASRVEAAVYAVREGWVD